MEYMSSESRTSTKWFGWDKLKIAKTLIMASGVIFIVGLTWYQMAKIAEFNEMLEDQKSFLKTVINNHGNHFKNITEGISDLQDVKRLESRLEENEQTMDQILNKINDQQKVKANK